MFNGEYGIENLEGRVLPGICLQGQGENK